MDSDSICTAIQKIYDDGHTSSLTFTIIGTGTDALYSTMRFTAPWTGYYIISSYSLGDWTSVTSNSALSTSAYAYFSKGSNIQLQVYRSGRADTGARIVVGYTSKIS